MSDDITTYGVYHFRAWVKTKYATSGYTPGQHEFEVWADDDPEIAAQRTASGSLWVGAVWKGSAPTDDAEAMAELEARADRAARTHRMAHVISTHGHDLLLRRFWPGAKGMTDLITDADPELVIKALSRKDARELAVRWGKKMPKTTRPDTSAVVQVLAWADSNYHLHSTVAASVADGPSAIALARKVLQAYRDGIAVEDFLATWSWLVAELRAWDRWLAAEQHVWGRWLEAEQRWQAA